MFECAVICEYLELSQVQHVWYVLVLISFVQLCCKCGTVCLLCCLFVVLYQQRQQGLNFGLGFGSDWNTPVVGITPAGKHPIGIETIIVTILSAHLAGVPGGSQTTTIIITTILV